MPTCANSQQELFLWLRLHEHTASAVYVRESASALPRVLVHPLQLEPKKTRVMTLICTAVTYRHCPFVLRMRRGLDMMVDYPFVLAARIFLCGSSVNLIHILSNERWSTLGAARRKVNVDLNASWSVMVAGTRPVSSSTLRTCSFLNIAMVFDNCAVTIMILVEPYTFRVCKAIQDDKGRPRTLSYLKTTPS
ncbi:uncharacterized protein [Palaemon carinicauda]|uniref:uncharacterized protein n=1 Tax=Palaemon carinicauda TaxID=392227 RepID=UPI0035B5BD2C